MLLSLKNYRKNDAYFLTIMAKQNFRITGKCQSYSFRLTSSHGGHCALSIIANWQLQWYTEIQWIFSHNKFE